MERTAIIDSTGTFRYSLKRIWDKSRPCLAFIMLNPSTADHEVDDPTIRRCVNFGMRLGFGSIEVVNLFAFRATNPKELLLAVDPIGPENDSHIVKAVQNGRGIIAAWGTKGTLKNRNIEVLKLLEAYNVYCLDITQGGHPKHPLYVKGCSRPSKYKFV